MHYSVLKNEVIDNLNIKPDGIYVDCTIGYAGHSSEILQMIPKGMLYGFDQDDIAIKYSTDKLSKIGNNFEIIKSNFDQLKSALEDREVQGVDGILFDLGFSSPQIDDESRGFSFMNAGPLDMRMDQSNSVSAKEIINSYSYDELSEIFFKYGEEKMSRNIAKKIIENKDNLNTTLELVECIKSAVGANYFYKNHPERKIFQAIRIEVNKELDVIKNVLPDAIKLLNKGGRICVISFHSLEDKIVKTIFKKYSDIDEMVRGLPIVPDEYKPLIKLVNKNPLLPTQKEIDENSRSKSAKLRVVERI